MSALYNSYITQLYVHVDAVRQDLPKICEKKDKDAFKRALINSKTVIQMARELQRFIKTQKGDLKRDRVKIHATEKQLLEKMQNDLQQNNTSSKFGLFSN